VVRVDLAYGETGLAVDVPDDAFVVTPTELEALPDEAAAVTMALAAPVSGPPLAESVRPGMTVAVVFPDLTRPFPHRTVLPPLLAAIEAMGATPRLICATGTHRQATRAEMSALIGPETLARYDVHDHVATDSAAHAVVGRVDGVEVLVDRAYLDTDRQVVTGFVEPHFFAGYSGGPKAVVPGLAALTTILEAHSPARIGDPRATWTELDGNPVHDFVRRAVALAPPTMSLDVAINGARELTAVYAGTLPEAHRAACAFVERTAVQRVPHRFDVVVTTNAGHPLDRNLYQAVKGMAAAERIVTPGGTIIVAAACGDGIPDEGEFGRLLATTSSAEDLLRLPSGHDQWQAQVLGRVLRHARVELFSGGLTEAQTRACHLVPVHDISAAVAAACQRHGSAATVAVLPLGPLTVATAPDSRELRA
jgi:nickel-dependent lactate racemase